MSRAASSFAKTTATISSARRRPATVATVALLILCPLGVAACGGTKVSETTPKSTPEITAPAATVSKEATTKSHSASGSATGSEASGETEAGASEAIEAPESGGTEAVEEPATGGEEAPAEETEPVEEEPAAGNTGGATAP